MAVDLNYSLLDRLLHRVAFAGSFVQLAAADMERTLYGSSYEAAPGTRPIFVTSLPRAGTTLMLEALHRFPSLASHTYRDMPFVLAPVFWARLSASFHKPQELRERAHGDGMEVGYDSPEAFEEIIWRAFWPEKYHQDRIDLWSASDGKPDARAFFVEHMKKIVFLRRPDRLADARYVSKNNGNVARLDLLGPMFSDARILVPVRRPLEHARSLLTQHRRFLQMHEEEPFVRRYMCDIGHYEFGSLHKLIAFPGVDLLTKDRSPLGLDYWLSYWISAFEHVLARRQRLVLVSYEGCCARPRDTLERLCRELEIPDEGGLDRAAALFREAPPARPSEDVDRALLERAESLYASLMSADVGT